MVMAIHSTATTIHVSKIVSCFALLANLQLTTRLSYSFLIVQRGVSFPILAHFSRMASSSSSTTTSCLAAGADSSLTVAQFPCLNDNYGYLVHDNATGETAAIDTPCAATYRQVLQERGWKLTHILNTHHHWDHVGGNVDLKQDGVKVFGPATEDIPEKDVSLKGGDTFDFGSAAKVQVFDVGGHTKGHIAYYFTERESKRLLFCGDSLFALGCGRMFEGTPAQFWTSLQTLRSFPDDTLVYCAHEYTESNARFALSIEPGNAELQARALDVKQKRSSGQPTVPSTLGEEKRTNPFLRVDCSEEIRRNVGVQSDDTDAEAFRKVRLAKDQFH
jgi:hydroxyacylglutathione hydrolase